MNSTSRSRPSSYS